ncbi:transcriptional regulator [Spirochaetia bacterium]|nr:transcriptional regulator [Spirochaetia bacterium]
MDKFQIAQTNKYNVIHCLTREGPINRVAIARRTDLSVPTVMSIIDELFAKGIIRSIGKGEFLRGKPPEMLEIVPDRFFYIGVDIGRTTIRIVANNAISRQILCFQEPTGDPFPEQAFVERLRKLILRIVKRLHTNTERILGAGIAMPGLIENETGRVLVSPDFGWQDIPLQALLQKDLPFPVLVDNSNRALALNESYISGEEDHSHTTFAVNLGYGIGGALVMGEQLYSGASGTSGEIGHSTVDPNGPVCKCGKAGCLEAVASGEAIARLAREALSAQAKARSTSKMAELCGGDPEKIDAALVFRAAELGDKIAMKIIDDAAEYIGIMLSTSINVLDPDRLVLCGGLMKNGPWFFEKIKISIEKYKMKLAGRELVISVGLQGEYSTANGACKNLANTLWWQRALPV